MRVCIHTILKNRLCVSDPLPVVRSLEGDMPFRLAPHIKQSVVTSLPPTWPTTLSSAKLLMLRAMMSMFNGSSPFAAGGNLANLQLFENSRKRQKMIENPSSSAKASSASLQNPQNGSMLQLENGNDAEVAETGKHQEKENATSQARPVGDMFEIPEIAPAKPAKTEKRKSAEESVEEVAKAAKNRERAKKEKKADDEELKTPKSKPKSKAKARAKAGTSPPAKAGNMPPIDSPMSAEKVPVMKQGDPTLHWRAGKVQRNGGNWRCFKNRTDRKDKKFKIGATEDEEKKSFIRALKWIEEPE